MHSDLVDEAQGSGVQRAALAVETAVVISPLLASTLLLLGNVVGIPGLVQFPPGCESGDDSAYVRVNREKVDENLDCIGSRWPERSTDMEVKLDRKLRPVDVEHDPCL